MTEDLFNVVTFDVDGYWAKVGHDLPAKAAVELAKTFSAVAPLRPAGCVRIIITDDDNTCFEWKLGVGVTFPPPQ